MEKLNLILLAVYTNIKWIIIFKAKIFFLSHIFLLNFDVIDIKYKIK